MVRRQVIDQGYPWTPGAGDSRVEVVANASDECERGKEFPFILQMKAEAIFATQLRDGRAVDHIVPVVDAVTQAVGWAQVHAVLCFQVIGLRGEGDIGAASGVGLSNKLGEQRVRGRVNGNIVSLLPDAEREVPVLIVNIRIALIEL